MTNINVQGADVSPDVRKAARWFIVEGVLLAILGVLAAALPALRRAAGVS